MTAIRLRNRRLPIKNHKFRHAVPFCGETSFWEPVRKEGSLPTRQSCTNRLHLSNLKSENRRNLKFEILPSRVRKAGSFAPCPWFPVGVQRVPCPPNEGCRKCDNLMDRPLSGIGFKSAFKVADCVEVYSNGFRFKFDRNHVEDKLTIHAADWKRYPLDDRNSPGR